MIHCLPFLWALSEGFVSNIPSFVCFVAENLLLSYTGSMQVLLIGSCTPEFLLALLT